MKSHKEEGNQMMITFLIFLLVVGLLNLFIYELPQIANIAVCVICGFFIGIGIIVRRL